jgi:hypothetical protein
MAREGKKNPAREHMRADMPLCNGTSLLEPGLSGERRTDNARIGAIRSITFEKSRMCERIRPGLFRAFSPEAGEGEIDLPPR